MPDKRVKGATEYSTHPATMRARQRLLNMPMKQRAAQRNRNYEYSAIKACCLRVSQREDYQHASVSARRGMLLSQVGQLMTKRYVYTSPSPASLRVRKSNNCARRELGKVMCGLNEEAIVDRHLKREADIRASKRGSKQIRPCLKGVSMDSRAKAMAGQTDTTERTQGELPAPISVNSRVEAPTNQKDATARIQGDLPTPVSIANDPNSPNSDDWPPHLKVDDPPQEHERFHHGMDVHRLVAHMEDIEHRLNSLNNFMEYQSNQLHAQGARITALEEEVHRYRLSSRPPPAQHAPPYQRFFPINLTHPPMYSFPSDNEDGVSQFTNNNSAPHPGNHHRDEHAADFFASPSPPAADNEAVATDLEKFPLGIGGELSAIPRDEGLGIDYAEAHRQSGHLAASSQHDGGYWPVDPRAPDAVMENGNGIHPQEE